MEKNMKERKREREWNQHKKKIWRKNEREKAFTDKKRKKNRKRRGKKEL